MVSSPKNPDKEKANLSSLLNRNLGQGNEQVSRAGEILNRTAARDAYQDKALLREGLRFGAEALRLPP